jgi:hypothetical protein
MSDGGLSLLKFYLRLKSETVRYECVWKAVFFSKRKTHGRNPALRIGLTVGSFHFLTATLAKEDPENLQIYAQAFDWNAPSPHHGHGMQGMQMFYSSSSVKELSVVGLQVQV